MSFDLGWFFGGMMLIIASAVFIVFHRQIADAVGSGVADYDRYKLWGLIALGIGVLAMLNIVPMILNAILGQIFNRP